VRDVFEPGDAWVKTRDLLRRDADGDCWLFDRLPDLIRAAGGPVAGRSIEERAYAMGGIALAVAYGIRLPTHEEECVALALALRANPDLDTNALLRELDRAPALARPTFVRVVDAVPMTEGFRPRRAALAAEGIHADGRTFAYDVERSAYVLLATEPQER
jgi:acyl-CoA synthetase (AMP-forming)/AMP-acid ligase II